MECLLCKKELQGRRDKKFCNANCRSEYHNRFKRDNRVLKINKTLLANRLIMARLLKQKKYHKVLKQDLLLSGMDFHFFTHIHQTKEGKTYFFCYDLGYAKLDSGLFLLVREK